MTVEKGFDQLKHFSLLFMLIFVCFSLIATYVFQEDYEEFGDLQKSMTTQV